MSTERPYRSTLREERALETRRRIRTAARDLFVTNGFPETTIAQIAERAGVAPQTVYAVFGSKAGIVIAMLEDMEESADRTSRIAEVLAESDPHQQLRLFVSWIRTLFEQGAPVLRAAFQARGDPDVDAVAERGDGNRRFGTKKMTEIWASKGALRSGLDPDQAAEWLWLLSSAEQFMLAADSLGWSADEYERWLGDLLERELLEPS